MTAPGLYELGELLRAFDGEELIVVLCRRGATIGEDSQSMSDSLSPPEKRQKVRYDGEHIMTPRGGRVMYNIFRDRGPKVVTCAHCVRSIPADDAIRCQGCGLVACSDCAALLLDDMQLCEGCSED